MDEWQNVLSTRHQVQLPTSWCVQCPSAGMGSRLQTKSLKQSSSSYLCLHVFLYSVWWHGLWVRCHLAANHQTCTAGAQQHLKDDIKAVYISITVPGEREASSGTEHVAAWTSIHLKGCRVIWTYWLWEACGVWLWWWRTHQIFPSADQIWLWWLPAAPSSRGSSAPGSPPLAARYCGPSLSPCLYRRTAYKLVSPSY